MSVPQADIEKLFKASERKSSNRGKQIPINLSCLYPLSAFCTKSSLVPGGGGPGGEGHGPDGAGDETFRGLAGQKAAQDVVDLG